MTGYDIIIVGGGPAGLTAALYARRAGKSVLIAEKAAPGGQITWSPRVENYPALESFSGADFADRLLKQTLDLGAELVSAEVTRIDGGGVEKRVFTASGDELGAKAVIIAAGAKPRRLGIDGEERLIGAGIGFCAVCDGAFYRGLPVAVVGGGDTALKEALFLADICGRVYLIHRRAALRGEKQLARALAERGNVELLLGCRVTSLSGIDALDGVTVTDGAGAQRQLRVSGLFVAVGHEPDCGQFRNVAALDENGYISAGENCLTGVPGIFAAGDCRAKKVRQLTTAAADGAVAALAACEYIDSL